MWSRERTALDIGQPSRSRSPESSVDLDNVSLYLVRHISAAIYSHEQKPENRVGKGVSFAQNDDTQ